jgi:hypothetical protein
MLNAVLKGFRAARKDQHDVATFQSRLTAALHRYPRNKLLPSLEELLKPPRAGGKQSTDEMLANFQEMQAAGAPIKIKKVG